MLDPLQEAFVRNIGAQCGFCTPGQIMSAKALLLVNPVADTAGDRRVAFREHLPLRRLSGDRRSPSKKRLLNWPNRSVR